MFTKVVDTNTSQTTYVPKYYPTIKIYTPTTLKKTKNKVNYLKIIRAELPSVFPETIEYSRRLEESLSSALSCNIGAGGESGMLSTMFILYSC